MKIDAAASFHSKDSDTINWYIQDIKNQLGNITHILATCNKISRVPSAEK